MNVLSRSLHNIYTHPRAQKRAASTTRSAMIAKRLFKEEKHPYPLHEAAKNSNTAKVQAILKSSIIPVNSLDDEGELPLGIAVKQYRKAPSESKQIVRILFDFGACYLRKDSKGCSPLQYLEETPQKLSSDLVEMQIKADALTHMLTGCGQNTKGCLFDCKKKPGNYSPELKATVALQSLTTHLSVSELAYLHQVNPSDVIEWRRQAREGLIKLFQDSK